MTLFTTLAEIRSFMHSSTQCMQTTGFKNVAVLKCIPVPSWGAQVVLEATNINLHPV